MPVDPMQTSQARHDATSPIDWKAFNAESVCHFRQLLRIDTTNPPGNEAKAARYIEELLSREGIQYDTVEPEPGRRSLVARLEGSGRKEPLLLNGHLDVVPADPDCWDHPPFSATVADGCIWGRGAIDMKNMVTMSLMTLILLHRLKVPLDRDVIFAAVADEEAGSEKGSAYLVENHPDWVRSEYVLNEVGGHTLFVGDSRFYPVQVSEKGICWFQLKARGEPGHGSMPHPRNAVVQLARAVERLGRVRLPQHNTEVVEGFLRRLASGAPFPQNLFLPMLLQPALAGRLLDVLSRSSLDQSMSFNAMLRNTVSPTILEAGKKVNVIPTEATATLDGRVLPGHSVESFLREVQEVIGPDLEMTVLTTHDGTRFDAETPLYDAICETLGRHDPAGIPVPYMIPGFTDSFAYGQLGAICYGFSPVLLGPDLNFTRMYHGHNERIPVEGYQWGQRVLYELVERFCGAGS